MASDTVLFSVNGKAVTTDEFSRYCVNVAQTETMPSERQLDDYISFRLKVEDATCYGLDTMPEFRHQLEILKGEASRAYMMRHKRSQTSGDDGSVDNRYVKLSIATIPLPQSASKKMEYDALLKMDSLYSFVVNNGGDWGNFPDWARDGIVLENEVVKPYAGLLKEFSAQISMIGKGQTSRPFVSPFGIHIIRLENRDCENDDAEPFDEKELEERLNEIHDGLLAVYWEEWRYGSGSAFQKVSPNLLSAYYEAHRKDYLWDLPHYKGAVIHCSDKKYESKIKKALKKLPVEVWGERLAALMRDNPEWKAEIENGLFRIGDNAYIDNTVFKCGNLPARRDNSYFFVMGKKLLKGPGSYLDVLSQVRKDYLNWRKKELMRELRARYKVEINQDVLKTVNSYATN